MSPPTNPPRPQARSRAGDDLRPPSKRKLLSFDIEIANLFQLKPGEDLDKYAPFDISVAAAVSADDDVAHWYKRDAQGRPQGCLDATLAREVLRYLRDAQQNEVQVCAWNGLAFDLRWLGHAAGDPLLAAEVALDLYDPMFQFAVMKGFPISLAAAAEGLSIRQKKLMSADRAPLEWAQGNHQLVIDYVTGDCQITNQVVAAIVERRCVRWKTQKGVIRSESFPELRRVRDVMRDPPPDQSWMTAPKPKEAYYAWLAPHLGKIS